MAGGFEADLDESVEIGSTNGSSGLCFIVLVIHLPNASLL
jgi:hypothetical protein